MKKELKKLWWIGICFLVMLYVPQNIQASESITGGSSAATATEINWNTEYNMEGEDGWFKLKIPENLYCIGAGYDEFTEIAGYAGNQPSADNSYKEWNSDGYVKLGDCTSYWDCVGSNDAASDLFRYYYRDLAEDTYACFYIWSEKTDRSTFHFVPGTYTSDSATGSTLLLNQDYTESYYKNNEQYGIYYTFTAENTGAYKVILKSENGSADCKIALKDGTRVPTKADYLPEFTCGTNRISESIVSVKKGTPYLVYVTPSKMSAESQQPLNITVQVSDIPVSSIEVSTSELTMYTHENAQLNPTVFPDNAAYRNVTYTSSDPDVAAVSENGLVTAVGCGTAKITIRADDGSDTETCCAVTVLPKLVTKLILNTTYIEDTAFINGGNTHQLSASVYPDDADNTAVTFTSSNPEIVSADASTGLLTLNKPGTAIITCMADDGSHISTTCQINVIPQLATKLELYESHIDADLAICEKNDYCLHTGIYPENANDTSVTFTSSNPKIVSVDASSGQLLLNRPGSAVITCTTHDGSNLRKTCVVTVKQSHFRNEKITDHSVLYQVTSDKTGGGTVTVYGISNKNAKSVVIPDSVEIDGYSYRVTSIKNRAFYNCKKLTAITIGQNITGIGKEAFLNCKKLKSIRIQSTKIKTAGKNAFKNISPKATIKVPASKISKYRKLFRGKGQRASVKIKKIR